jgi:hypothetical protein
VIGEKGFFECGKRGPIEDREGAGKGGGGCSSETVRRRGVDEGVSGRWDWCFRVGCGLGQVFGGWEIGSLHDNLG